MKKLTALFGILSIIAGALLGVVPAAADDSASIYLVPASGSVSKSGFQLNIYEDSGSSQVNAVQANLSYPTKQLTYVSSSYSSDFGVHAQNEGGGGSVKIGEGTITPVTGKQFVGSVVFKAAPGASGTAAVNFAKGTAVVKSTDNKNLALKESGGNYTLSSSPKAYSDINSSGSGGGSGSGSQSSGGSGNGSGKSGSEHAFKFSGIEVENIGTDKVTIVWQTSVPATSEVDYGVSANKYFLSINNSNKVRNHKLTIGSDGLAPGGKYHFVVKGVDGQGSQSESADQTFVTKGATLLFNVDNQSKQALTGAKITVNTKTGIGDVHGTTGPNGQATLTGLPVGKLHGTVSYNGQEMNFSVVVKPIGENGFPKGANTPQKVSLIFKANKGGGLSTGVIIAIIIAALIVLGLIYYFLIRKKKLKTR